MIVNNVNDFIKFLSGDEISIKGQLESCVKTASKICGCQKSRKMAKVNECNRLYVEFVKNNADSLVDFFKKLTADNDIRFYHNTHELIKVVKLR